MNVQTGSSPGKLFLPHKYSHYATLTGVLTAVLFCAATAFAGDVVNESAGAAQMRQLNNSLLQIHEAAQQAGDGNDGAVRRQAAAVIHARAAALRRLIAEEPKQAAALALSPDALAELKAQFPGNASELERWGRWYGPVEHWVSDDAAMTHHRDSYFMEAGGKKYQLFFINQDGTAVQSGYAMEVTGVQSGTNIAVTSSTTTSTATSCSTAGVQNTAVILATFPGVTPPSSLTPQSVSTMMFGASAPSVNDYWHETSYGLTSAAGDVFGWYTLNGTYSSTACQSLTQMENDALVAAAAAGANFQNYSRVMIVFPDTLGCGWAGVSSIGCYALNTPSGTVTASTSFLAAANVSVQLATHELGHGLGLNHAATRSFGTETLGPLGVAGTLTEYADKFSTMGCCDLAEYGAPHKAEILNWLPPNSGYETVQTSGTYVLTPYEVPGGLKALKVQRGTGNNAWLWLEYRQPDGYDSKSLPSPLWTTLAPQPFSGALIHYEDSTTGLYTHLINYNPTDTSFYSPALVAGQSWSDPYTNVSLAVTSATSSGLTVNVNYGTAPCTHANPSITVSPSNPSVYAGSSVNYTVSVTNNDASGCSAASFTMAGGQPSGWSSTFSSGLLTLNPGQTGSVTLTESVPIGTTPATYALMASASNGPYAASAPANCTVLSAPATPVLTVNLSTSASSYSARQTVSATATVASGTTAATGAAVTFTLLKADGTKVTKTATTGSNGSAALNYKLSPKDPKGVYSCVAQATYNAQSAASNTVSFTVK